MNRGKGKEGEDMEREEGNGKEGRESGKGQASIPGLVASHL